MPNGAPIFPSVSNVTIASTSSAKRARTCNAMTVNELRVLGGIAERTFAYGREPGALET